MTVERTSFGEKKGAKIQYEITGIFSIKEKRKPKIPTKKEGKKRLEM